MGERLNIEIEANDKTVANAYYHWGAYTTSAIALVKKMVDYLDTTNDTYQNEQEFALRLLEATGANLTEDEHKYATTLQLQTKPFDEDVVNRNDGLISLSEEGINGTRTWQEMMLRVQIDIKNRSIHIAFDDVFDIVSLDDYKNQLEEYGDEYIEEDNAYDETLVNTFMTEDYIDVEKFKSAYQAFEKLIASHDVFYADKGKTVVAVAI